MSSADSTEKKDAVSPRVQYTLAVLPPLEVDPFSRRIRWEIRILALLFPLLNRLFRLSRLVPLLRPKKRNAVPQLDHPQRVIHLISSRIRRLPGRRDNDCLRRTLLAYRYLRIYGFSPEIHIGLKGDDRDLGHCWIAIDGKPICEDRDVEHEFPERITQDSDIVFRI